MFVVFSYIVCYEIVLLMKKFVNDGMVGLGIFIFDDVYY